MRRGVRLDVRQNVRLNMRLKANAELGKGSGIMQYIELSLAAAFLLRVNIITAPAGLVNIIIAPAGVW